MTSDPQDLCDVVNEITAALLDGDWSRHKSEEDDRYYYVVRERDHAEEIARRMTFDHILIFRRPEANTFLDWYIRAALAEEPSDRLTATRMTPYTR
jgi:hypothetical protein